MVTNSETIKAGRRAKWLRRGEEIDAVTIDSEAYREWFYSDCNASL